MTWYYGKQKTLLFEGKDGNELRETIVKACMAKSTTNNQNQLIGMSMKHILKGNLANKLD